MEVNVYKSLLAFLTIAEKRFKDYLNNTPNNVVQGDRGALKDAMNDLGRAFETIGVPDGIVYAEVVKDALDSLKPAEPQPLVKGDNAITSGEQEFNQDGSRIDGADKVEEVKVSEETDIDLSDEEVDVNPDDIDTKDVPDGVNNDIEDEDEDYIDEDIHEDTETITDNNKTPDEIVQ